MSIIVAKADGTTEEYDPKKLVGSLRRAGAADDVAHTIAKDVEKELWSGITTQEIYSRAFKILREHRHTLAARYSLKRAVLEFGPSGFPFEAFIAELYKTDGWETHIDQIVKGKCVEHEVDVVMKKGSDAMYVEAKFHNAAGFKTDLKVVLYVKARVDDIGHGKGLVVTNTKFTDKAIQYSECAGLELLSWDYPQHATLHSRIEKAKLYPITALTTLNNREKTALLGQKIVLCSTLTDNTRALESAGITGARADVIFEEIGALCAS